MSITIHRLCDAPEWAGTCKEWDIAEWPRNPDIAEFFGDHYGDAIRHAKPVLPQAWVALDQGKPIGMMSLIAEDHPDFLDKRPWLAAAFVLPPYRGQGVFKKLQDHVVLFARDELKIEALFVHSHLDFTKWGWTVDQETHDPFAPEKRVTIFKRKF